MQVSGLGVQSAGVVRDGGLHGSGPGLGGGGLTLPGDGGHDFWSNGFVRPGDYSQEVIEVFEAFDEREDLYAGAVSTVTIEEGPNGGMLHGFIELQVTELEIVGSGITIESDPDYDCTWEWMQTVEGRAYVDGTLELEISEIVAVAGKQCGMTDLGDPQLQRNSYAVVLTPY